MHPVVDAVPDPRCGRHLEGHRLDALGDVVGQVENLNSKDAWLTVLTFNHGYNIYQLSYTHSVLSKKYGVHFLFLRHDPCKHNFLFSGLIYNVYAVGPTLSYMYSIYIIFYNIYYIL